MADSFNTINGSDCENFINDTLSKYKVDKKLNSLDKLLAKAVFGYYDRENPDYADTQLGVDIESTILLRDAIVNRKASAHTVRYRDTGESHVFLTDDVFYRNYGYLNYFIADTPGFIVHELFHVAGIDHAVVDSQLMTNEIFKHCHLVGSNVIELRH